MFRRSFELVALLLTLATGLARAQVPALHVSTFAGAPFGSPLGSPFGVSVDAGGNVYVVNDGFIHKVLPDPASLDPTTGLVRWPRSVVPVASPWMRTAPLTWLTPTTSFEKSSPRVSGCVLPTIRGGRHSIVLF